MSADRYTLPPVRLPSEAELARDALAAPLLARAVRLARWAGSGTRVGPDGELVDEQLPAAAEQLGLGEDLPEGEGEAYAAEAWSLAVDTSLVEVDEEDAEESPVRQGEQLALVTAGGPGDVLALWLDALDAVFTDATVPEFEELAGALGEDGEIDFEALDWDPEAEAAFLEGVLGNLYLFSVDDEGELDGAVPLPALAASMIVPDDMPEPSDEVLEQVSAAMIRLDEQFRLFDQLGVVAYTPVDESLVTLATEEDEGPEPELPVDEADVHRYGMVRLTPLGLHGIRVRMREAEVGAPVLGELAEADARTLLDGIGHFPEAAMRTETEQWLKGRSPADAARELLAAARGGDEGAPLRRLTCQQALALAGPDAEPEVRAVLDDPQLGGLARVWLAELGGGVAPPPPPEMVYWLAIDTIAAQLDAGDEPDELQELVEGLVGTHDRFFEEAWRVDHPATADVLEAVGRLHRDRATAKEARKAAFKARSGGESPTS